MTLAPKHAIIERVNVFLDLGLIANYYVTVNDSSPFQLRWCPVDATLEDLNANFALSAGVSIYQKLQKFFEICDKP